ncbi:MAG: hypothetical protein ACRC24_03430 [Vibrionaceae bacterium]
MTNVAQSAEEPQTVAAAKPLSRTPSDAQDAQVGDWVETASVHSGTSLDSTLGQMPFVRAKFAHWPKALKPAAAKGSFDIVQPEGSEIIASSMLSFAKERLPLGVRDAAMKAFLDQIIPADPSQKQALDAEFNAILDKHGISDKAGMMELFEPLLVKYAKLATTPETQLESGARGSAQTTTQERFAYLQGTAQAEAAEAPDLSSQKEAIRKEASARLNLNAAGHLASSKMAADFSAHANAAVDRSHAGLQSPELRQFCNAHRKLIAALVHEFAGIIKMGVVKETDFTNMAGMSITTVSRATDSQIPSQAEFQALANVSQEVARDVKELLKTKMMTMVDHANLNVEDKRSTIFTDATGQRLTSTRLTEFTALTFTLMEFIFAQQNSTTDASILQDGTFTSPSGASLNILNEFAKLPPEQQLNKEAMAEVLLDNMKREMTAL